MTKKKTTNAKNSSVRKGLDGLYIAISEYVATIDEMFSSTIATEHTYREALTKMLRALLPGMDVWNEPKQIDCGALDCIILKDKLPVAFVEAKKVGTGDLDGKKTTGNKEQFDRYKANVANIAFTDYIDFHFYTKGELVASVRIGEIEGNRIRPLPDNFGKFQSFVERLGDAKPQKITSPTQLAQLMAAKARNLQLVAHRFLESGDAKGSMLWELMEGFKRVLIPGTTPEEFADTYAQTLTYGMFAARLHDDTPEDFSREEAARLIPKSNPFLRKLFNHINSDIDKEIEWAVDDIVRLFAAADVRGIMKDYGKSKKHNDPMIHFYEDFLNAYDAGLRKDRGVWYTPLPVVKFIVRAVDDLLAQRFGIKDGLADNNRIEVTPNTAQGLQQAGQTDIHRVQILDPATGTGTFLAECVNRIHEHFIKDAGIWPDYVAEDLIPRLNGFELLMAPYTMAHIKLDRVLSSTGYEHTGDNRFNIFLTNSLEGETGQKSFDTLLGMEAQAANDVKRSHHVMVVVGNPPYAVSSMNKGKWIQDKIKSYKNGLKERKINLDDDYIKFIRLGQIYIDRTDEGILAYISNNSFLDGITHRQMRKSLMKTFDEIYILNLHGNARKKETTPNGGKDENVFSIMQGVSINIFVKRKRNDDALRDCTVRYADLWGTREHKYDRLSSLSLKSIKWQTIDLREPYWFFVPKDFGAENKYKMGFSVKDLFPLYNSGIKTDRDSLFIDDDPVQLKERIAILLSHNFSQSFRDTYRVEDSGSYKITERIQNATINGSLITHESFRPFDDKCIYYDTKLISRPANSVMKHMLNDNICLTVSRQCQSDWRYVFCSDKLSDVNLIASAGLLGSGYVFPLYIYQDMMGTIEKVPNLDNDTFGRIADGLNRKPKPEELFDYIYAVLHTPEYRERYKEFLKVDFPRIPYPTNAAVFKKLAKIGGELRETHLLKTSLSSTGRKPIANFPKKGDMLVDNVRFVNGKVYINDEQYFDHVPEEAWDMFIGGYQPAQKWLKDRKGRTLSSKDIKHYQAIIPALMRTHALMQKLSALSKDWLK